MTVFSACLEACGLTHDQAARVLGQSISAIKKKSSGAREITPEDGAALATLWHRIRIGETDGLPVGAVEMAAALRILRGVDRIPERRRKPAAG